MMNLSHDINSRNPRCPQKNLRRDFVDRLKNEMEFQPSALRPRPLPPDVRHEFEAKLAQDLSDVCIYESPAVANLCQTAGAQAFVQGNNIFFMPGKYQPHSLEGKAQLMHELTDVIQRKQYPSELMAAVASEKAKKAAAQAEEDEDKAAVAGISAKVAAATDRQGGNAKQKPLGFAPRAGEPRQIKRFNVIGATAKDEMIEAVKGKARAGVRDWNAGNQS